MLLTQLGLMVFLMGLSLYSYYRVYEPVWTTMAYILTFIAMRAIYLYFTKDDELYALQQKLQQKELECCDLKVELRIMSRGNRRQPVNRIAKYF